MFDVAENRSFQISCLLHVAVVLIFLIGFPNLFEDNEPTPTILSVEILPISAVSNVKPSEKPLQKAMVAKAPVKVPPKPVTPPQQQKAAATPKDAVPIPDKQKPPPPKVEKESEKEDSKSDAKSESDFQKMMQNLQKEADKSQKTDPKSNDTVTKEENKTKSDANYDPTKPLSMSAIDAIKSQFIQCWSPPIGARESESLKVRVEVRLSQDGTVVEAKLSRQQDGNSTGNPFFRAAADSAVRAVHICSPLKNLPAAEYSSWSWLELTFDPKDLI